MSLKAYDGMVTKKGLPYLHSKLSENLELFKKASEEHIAKAFADIFINYVDDKVSPQANIGFNLLTKEDKRKISEVDLNDITIFNYVFKVSEVLINSVYVNSFTSNLKITIEPVGKKLLVYPNIFVPKHREILLTFLDCYYAQNQTDKPDNVTTRAWNKRCEEWYAFDNVRGLQTTISLFDPTHFWHNILGQITKENLVSSILTQIPTDEKRIQSILKRNFINSKMIDKFGVKEYYDVIHYLLTEDGKKEFDDYKNNNSITITKIDYDFITKTKLLNTTDND